METDLGEQLFAVAGLLSQADRLNGTFSAEPGLGNPLWLLVACSLIPKRKGAISVFDKTPKRRSTSHLTGHDIIPQDLNDLTQGLGWKSQESNRPHRAQHASPVQTRERCLRNSEPQFRPACPSTGPNQSPRDERDENGLGRATVHDCRVALAG